MVGVFSFLAALTIITAKQKFQETSLKNIQLLSILSASVSLISSNISETNYYAVEYSLLSYLPLLMVVATGINLMTLFMSVVILIQKKKINLLFIVNILLSAQPLFWLIVFFFLIGIGLGPPS